MEMADKKVAVDEELCVGCQHCIETCPDIFQLDSAKNVAKVIGDSDKCDCNLEEVASGCPVGAITVE